MTGVNVSEEELQLWRDELSEIDAKIAALNERRALLQNALSFAAVVDRLKGGSGGDQMAAEEDQPHISSLRLPEAIVQVLERHNQPMTPRQIRQALRTIGYNRDHRGPYFYTAFRRLKDNKKVSQLADGRYVPGKAFEAD